MASGGRPTAPPIRVGNVDFQPPRSAAAYRGLSRVRTLVLLGFGAWAIAGFWHRALPLGLLAGFVYLELALLGYRASMAVGDVVCPPEVAWRIAAPLEEICWRAGCALPRVLLRERSTRPISLVHRQQRVTLTVSRELVDRLDDRQLRAVIAHEVVHIARGDARQLLAIVRVLLVVLFVGAEVVIFTVGRGLTSVPLVVAGLAIALILVRLGLSPLTRSRERRADAEGAWLCGDPLGMASALVAAKGLIEDIRARILGQQPWKLILLPVSFRSPSHPSIGERTRRLEQIAAANGPPPATPGGA